MIYPKFLQDNGRIGFIAPSFGCVQEPYATLFDNTIAKFQRQGYRTVLGPNCRVEVGDGKSNTPEECAKEINDFFSSDKSDVIISCGGGETMCEDLPYVDFDKIKQSNPKWYMGYSDNTNLTFILNTMCDIASIYGPCAASFGAPVDSKYVLDAFDLLRGKKLKFNNYDKWYLEPKPCGINIDILDKSFIADGEDTYNIGITNTQLPIEIINDKQYIVMPYKQQIFLGEEKSSEESFKGRLIGGCLDCLCHLVGTEFDKVKDFNEKYKEDGIIWFMESCDLNVMSIRRALWQMESAGWFKYVKGFLIGRPLHYNDTFGDFDRIAAVKGILGKYNVPIVMDMDLGHLSPAMPIVSGAIGEIIAKDNSLSVEYVLE